MKFRELLILIVVAVNLPWSAGAFTREELVCPVQEDWKERSEERWKCPCEKGWKPTEEQLREILDAHQSWVNGKGSGDSTVSRRAVLCNADLIQANLTRANLRKASLVGVDLQRADLRIADLQWADLKDANLQKADLLGANLQEADLETANLQEADLEDTNLRKANLLGADLRRANLLGSDVEGTELANATLARAMYAPSSPPPDGYVEGIEGLATVMFPAGQQSGLVQLRELLQKSGLRNLEREATFAIEQGKAR